MSVKPKFKLVKNIELFLQKSILYIYILIKYYIIVFQRRYNSWTYCRNLSLIVHKNKWVNLIFLIKENNKKWRRS